MIDSLSYSHMTHMKNRTLNTCQTIGFTGGHLFINFPFSSYSWARKVLLSHWSGNNQYYQFTLNRKHAFQLTITFNIDDLYGGYFKSPVLIERDTPFLHYHWSQVKFYLSYCLQKYWRNIS